MGFYPRHKKDRPSSPSQVLTRRGHAEACTSPSATFEDADEPCPKIPRTQSTSPPPSRPATRYMGSPAASLPSPRRGRPRASPLSASGSPQRGCNPGSPPGSSQQSPGTPSPVRGRPCSVESPSPRTQQKREALIRDLSVIDAEKSGWRSRGVSLSGLEKNRLMLIGRQMLLEGMKMSQVPTCLGIDPKTWRGWVNEVREMTRLALADREVRREAREGEEGAALGVDRRGGEATAESEMVDLTEEDAGSQQALRAMGSADGSRISISFQDAARGNRCTH